MIGSLVQTDGEDFLVIIIIFFIIIIIIIIIISAYLSVCLLHDRVPGCTISDERSSCDRLIACWTDWNGLPCLGSGVLWEVRWVNE